MGRRQRYSDSTRRALVDVAEELFAEHGYAATSLDAIAAGAEVSKGALYHHFSGKQAIFEAAVERVGSRAADAIAGAATDATDPWVRAEAGLRGFLAVVQQPGYHQVVVVDGPAALGHDRFRDQEQRSTYAVLDPLVRAALTSGQGDLEPAMLDTFTRALFGAVSAAGGSVAVSEDPGAAGERAGTAIGVLLAGLRTMLEPGTGPAER